MHKHCLIKFASIFCHCKCVYDAFSRHGDLEVTLKTAMQEFLGSITGSGQDLYVIFCSVIVDVILLLCPNNVYLHDIMQFLLQC